MPKGQRISWPEQPESLRGTKPRHSFAAKSSSPNACRGSSFSRSSYQFDASGQEQWVARDNGPGNYDDRAGFVAGDGSGQEAARTFGVEHKVTYFPELDFVVSVERHEAEHSRSLLGLRDCPNCRRQIHETETDNNAINLER